MGADLDQVMTQAEFAALVGTSQQAISEHVKSGLLARGATGREWLLAYCEQLRGQAAGHLSGDGIDLTRERALTERIDRQLKELQLRERLGELVPAAEVLPTWERMVRAAREELLNSVDRLATELAAVHGVEIDRELIEAQVHEVLNRLAGYEPDADGSDPQGVPAVESAPAPVDG